MLLPNRIIYIVDRSNYYYDKPIERGSMVFYNKDRTHLVAKPNARLAGIILNDVVCTDLEKHHLKWHKDDVMNGGIVSLCKHGQLMIKAIKGSKAEDKLYWSGRNFTNKKYNYLGLKHIKVGKILKTEGKFSTIEFKLPE